MNSRKDSARRRLLESLGPPAERYAQITDKELAVASYQTLRESVASQSELLDDEMAVREVSSEVAQMRDEKRRRARIGAIK